MLVDGEPVFKVLSDGRHELSLGVRLGSRRTAEGAYGAAPETILLFPLRGLVVSLAVVLVMAADPELEPIVLVAAFRRPVKDRVVAH
jgi:hypothetical protein